MSKAVTRKQQVEIIPPRRAGAPMGNLNRIKNQPRFVTQALVMRLLDEVEDPRKTKDKREARDRRRLVDWLVDVMITLAMDGDTTMIKIIIDRVEGTPHGTMMFKPYDEGSTVKESTLVTATREKLAEMTPEARMALYNSTLSNESGVEGSA